MGQQLGINESSNIIAEAIKAAGENFDRDFYHVHSAPGNLGFFVEIADRTLAKEISKVSKAYSDDYYVFSLNIPYNFFNDDQLPEDAALGLDTITHTEVKAELRCMDLISKTYKNWIASHGLFTYKDLIKIINEAINKLRKLKKLDLAFHGYKTKITEKDASLWLTEQHIPRVAGEEAEFFNVTLQVSDYYTPIGEHEVDSLIGESKLHNKSKKEVCLLRVTYTIYSAYLNWIKQNWPDVYDDYVNGKF